LSDGPGTQDIHRRIGAAHVRRDTRHGIEEIEACEVLGAVGRFHRDAFRRLQPSTHSPYGHRRTVAGHDERRIATVVFADLVGFTTFSESADPEHVKQIVDTCFESLGREVRAYGGQVDKIVGDALVALFGAPVAHEDDAERAVRCALQMQQTLAEQRERYELQIEMRIGVNTGEVLVGAMRATIA